MAASATSMRGWYCAASSCSRKDSFSKSKTGCKSPSTTMRRMMVWFFKSQPASCKLAAEVNTGSEAFSQRRTAQSRRGACFDQRATIKPVSAIKFTFGGELLFDEGFWSLLRLGAQFNLVRIIQTSRAPPGIFILGAVVRRRPEPFGKFFPFRVGRTDKALTL